MRAENNGQARKNRLLLFKMIVLSRNFLQMDRLMPGVQAFSPPTGSFDKQSFRPCRFDIFCASANDNGCEEGNRNDVSGLSNYQDSDGASKGIVGSLTDIVNRVSAAKEMNEKNSKAMQLSSTSNLAPQSPEELLDRLRKDYEERNYLWTGDLDLDCFDKDCVFTDPTISFVGTDKFVENTQNLVPIVETFAEDYRSDLLSISMEKNINNSGESQSAKNNDFYIETRWNMVGSLTASPWIFWKPKIDVIGRTKFWFRSDGENSGYRVYFYDESWEIPAWKALLQIITPADTISRTYIEN